MTAFPMQQPRRNLHLALKKAYFLAIQSGAKTVEYRLATPYWSRRLANREYEQISLTMGYPSRDDQSRRLLRPWRGCVKQTIVHPHFGDLPVTVFAIALGGTL